MREKPEITFIRGEGRENNVYTYKIYRRAGIIFLRSESRGNDVYTYKIRERLEKVGDYSYLRILKAYF
jgi:hypothetical protein